MTTTLKPPAFDHNLSYFESFPYPYRTLSDVWNGHFGRAADQLIDTLRPMSAIDAGCAMGVLVRQLINRGVYAVGFDSSVDAIRESRLADSRLETSVFLHDIREPFGKTADVVICIEVLEHLEEEDAAIAVANLCRMALKYVVFSSTPDDVDSIQHPNVQQPPYWDALFASRNFRKTKLSASNFCPWAVIYERAGEDPLDTPKEDIYSDTKKFPEFESVLPGGTHPAFEVVEDIMDEPVYEPAPMTPDEFAGSLGLIGTAESAGDKSVVNAAAKPKRKTKAG